MKKKIFLILISIILLTACQTQTSDKQSTVDKESAVSLVSKQDSNNPEFKYYHFNAEEAGYRSDRSNVLTPTFYIYAGPKTVDEANALVTEFEMSDVVEEWASNVYVIPPINGSTYSNDDMVAFIDLISQTPVANIKLIGIDEGATFVNNKLAPKYGYLIAGILTINGKVDEGVNLGEQVPTYIVNSDETVYLLYGQDDKKVSDTYQDQSNPLQKVVVSNLENELAKIFEDAWSKVLSQNYRMHNDITEFYNANVKEVTSGYGLEPVIDFEKLGIIYNQNEEVPLNGEGSYTWYEYVPKTIKEASKGTVPLIITLHGFANDPRLQGDTSGWVEVAAKEDIVVVSPEWQEKELNFAKVDGLGEEGVLELIDYLKETYPQIDTSRIYLTGLSAGGSKTALWAAKHSDVFAAGASVSAPGIDKEELTQLARDYNGNKIPYLYVVGDHDFFQMVPVDGSSPFGMPNIFFDDPNVSMFEFIQAYQRMNGLPVSSKPDLNLNPYFGVALSNQVEGILGDKEILSGSMVDVDNENQELIRLVTIKNLAHWNYRPEAAYIWNFFKQYERDSETGQLLFTQP
ncbi:poly(3-hydroxybutyrate) depolymerase [Streptococcus rupicaprae]|uniref:Poly(3-hydroxybutyrate) depolymerase n=1 Tax=Streptococcus rupicaprae TaxID=759619 RepID=A0ABV2FIE7_9STRE